MNLEFHFDRAKLKQNSNSFKKIFFYRICGTGMGAAACLLKEMGYEVEGGDLNFYPPMSTYLQSTGIPCHKLSDVSDDKLKSFDLIVVGNVVGRTTPDAARVEALGVPFCSFPAAMGALALCKVNVVGIAGTHGKTTTTYLMTQVFEALKTDPGYFIGGVIDGRPSSHLGSGKYFFIESDEYDCAYFEKISKFRQYEINHLVLTSLEFDHADIFSSVEDIENEFRAAIPEIDKSFIINTDYVSGQKLMTEFKSQTKAPWFSYGEKSITGPKPSNMRFEEDKSTFTLNLAGKDYQFITNLVGIQNILNLSTCILFAFNEGFSIESIQGAIKNLNMVKRRQEIRGSYKGHIVIDDFAHHPRAVKLTLDSIRKRYPSKKVFIVMDPASATARSALFQKEFADSIEGAAGLIIAKPERHTTAKGLGDLDCVKLAQDVKNQFSIYSSVAIALPELQNKIEEMLDTQGASKDVLLVLSNSTCLGLWESSFKDELQKL